MSGVWKPRLKPECDSSAASLCGGRGATAGDEPPGVSLVLLNLWLCFGSCKYK